MVKTSAVVKGGMIPGLAHVRGGVGCLRTN